MGLVFTLDLGFPSEDAGAGAVFFGGFLIAQFHVDAGERGVEVNILFAKGEGLIARLAGLGEAALVEEHLSHGVPCGGAVRILLNSLV